MKKETLYLDTSVPNAYYDSRVIWRFEYTKEWWKNELAKYDVFISEMVIGEIRATDDMRRREDLLRLIEGFKELTLSPEIEEIARGYVAQNIVPKAQFPDALHIATASFYKIDFLVTWNCKHLAEAHRRRKVKLFNTSAGLFVPEIVTPMELSEGGEEDV